MSRLLLATPFLIVLSAGAQAPEDNRPPLFFREDWKEIAAVTPVTQEHVANPKLQVALYGPGKDGIRKSHHDKPKDDPYYIWLGSCPANCAIALRNLFEGTTTNWWTPSFSPDTGLFYVNGSHGFSIEYLMPNEETGKVEDHQGGGGTGLWNESMLLALDYRTGKVRWSRTNPRTGGGNGILSTAGGLVFTNESGHLVALHAASGKVLWHVNPGGNLTGSPMSYEIDGRQFVLTPVDGVLYAWALRT
jgi:hypothetical protein